LKGQFAGFAFAILFVLGFGQQTLFGIVQVVPAEDSGKQENFNSDLLASLSRVLGIRMEVSGGILRPQSPRVLLFPRWNPLALLIPDVSPRDDGKHSSTASHLLFDAMNSPMLYKLQSSRRVHLGKVDRKNLLIQLNFRELSEIVYQGIPHEVFDCGMIFLHELIHLHVGLTDPPAQEALHNPYAKGKTVEYMNRIERELGYPERLHYYPRETNLHSLSRYSIFFGNRGGRIDLDPDKFQIDGS